MALGNLREFDPKKESVEDFYERFEFFCVANNIRGDNTDRKKAIFITLLGQETFTKLKVLASPTPVSDLSLDAIKQQLSQQFRPNTFEIAERFKFFKCNQMEQESATEYMGELRSLAKTCNFGAYLETVLRDQFVCGLRNVQCQRELLCEATLTVDTALKKARAAEIVCKETEKMQACERESEGYSMIPLTNTRKNTRSVCFRCGQHGHAAPDCKFKTAKCYACLKTGHLARVCQSKNKLEMPKKTNSGKSQGMYQLQEQSDGSSGGSTEEFLHSVFQLGNTCHKFIITVFINGVGVDMEWTLGQSVPLFPGPYLKTNSPVFVSWFHHQ